MIMEGFNPHVWCQMCAVLGCSSYFCSVDRQVCFRVIKFAEIERSYALEFALTTVQDYPSFIYCISHVLTKHFLQDLLIGTSLTMYTTE